MADPVSYFGLITSLVLPWIAGSVWVHWLLRQTGRWNLFIVLGQGYIVGLFLTTVIIRLWDAAGLSLHFWGICALMTGLSVAGLCAVHIQSAPARLSTESPRMETWQIVVTACIAALIVYRYTTIAQEILLRPLYAWDAWMNWAPKAVVWFHNNTLTPFVSPGDWLQQTGEPAAYTLGAHKAWKYPPTVPLIQLWGMLGAGDWDNTAINLPWLLGAVALGLALYGHLRLAGASILFSTLACYALLNLPYINVQTALAGYADSWVAIALGCAVFALHEWGESRQWPYALLALTLAIMCTQLKIPGLIMGGVVLLVLVTSIIRPGKKTSTVLLAATLLCLVYMAAIGIEFSIANIGRIELSTEGIVLPYIGRYDLDYHPIHGAILNTLFLMLNWNILWYAFCLLAVAKIIQWRQPLLPALLPSLELRALALTLLFIFFVYYFTNRHQFASDYTQVNRALIYSIPIMVFYLFNSIRRSLQCNGTDRAMTSALPDRKG